jgi:hypothetical protein
MDLDPELDVTLSDGRGSVTFRITAVDGAVDAWAIVEPHAPLQVVMGRAAALETRARLDTQIAARLAAGWVPRDAVVDATLPFLAPMPLPGDLRLQVSRAVETLTDGRVALRAADPTGQLWAACARFILQARALGVGMPGSRLARARGERRLGELAEAAGDIPAAIVHYRAAFAAHRGVGVTRRLALLERHWPATLEGSSAPAARTGMAEADAAPRRCASRRRSSADRSARHATGRDIARSPRAARSDLPNVRTTGTANRCALQEQTTMAKKPMAKVQLVCRIDPALNTRVRAEAARAGQTLSTFLERALARAVARQTSQTSAR